MEILSILAAGRFVGAMLLASLRAKLSEPTGLAGSSEMRTSHFQHC